MTDNVNRSEDKVLVLAPMEGKKVLDSIGNTDPRLFKGGNSLHAVKDLTTGLWYCKYEVGDVPQVLKQKFTKFGDLLKFTEAYFKRRNIVITEVID